MPINDYIGWKFLRHHPHDAEQWDKRHELNEVIRKKSDFILRELGDESHRIRTLTNANIKKRNHK